MKLKTHNVFLKNSLNIDEVTIGPTPIFILECLVRTTLIEQIISSPQWSPELGN